MHQDSCTTILVSKEASYDGSTIVARTEDLHKMGSLRPSSLVVVEPKTSPAIISFNVFWDGSAGQSSLPYGGARRVPKDVIWGAVGTTAIMRRRQRTKQLRLTVSVLGADLLIESGISEVDIPTLVLPYIKTVAKGFYD